MTDIQILIREAREIKAEMAEKKAQYDALVERIQAELKPGDFVVVDGVTCSVREGNRKWDLATALSLLPTDVKMKCIVTTPRLDEKLVRQATDALNLTDAAMVRPDDAKPVLDLAK
jgi:predicted kinase